VKSACPDNPIRIPCKMRIGFNRNAVEIFCLIPFFTIKPLSSLDLSGSIFESVVKCKTIGSIDKKKGTSVLQEKGKSAGVFIRFPLIAAVAISALALFIT